MLCPMVLLTSAALAIVCVCKAKESPSTYKDFNHFRNCEFLSVWKGRKKAKLAAQTLK